MILAGPLELIQGGVGLIGRVPVFLEQDPEQFWGIVSSVLDFDGLIAPIIEQAGENSVHLAIMDDKSGKDAPIPILGSTDIYKNDHILSTQVVLPDREWTITIAPYDTKVVPAGETVSLLLIYLMILFFLEYLIYKLYKKSEELLQNQERFEDFAHLSSDWVWECDDKLNLIYSSGSVMRIFGYAPEDLRGRNLLDLMQEDSREKITAQFYQAGISGDDSRIRELELWMKGKDDLRPCLRINGSIVRESGELKGYRGVARDVTNQKASEQKLNAYVDIINNNVPILQTDEKGIITQVNKAYCDLSGFDEEDLLYRDFETTLHPDIPASFLEEYREYLSRDELWSGEIKNTKKDGSYYWSKSYTLPLYDIFQQKTGYMTVGHDISAEKELSTISETDALTRISNRRKLDINLELQQNLRNRIDITYSLIMFDIDHFKQVNDQFGHLAGDDVLVTLARLISEKMRKTDIFGRWGGEEFLIICPGTDLKGAAYLAENLRKILESHTFKTVGSVTCSFGVASSEDSRENVNLLKKLDDALYSAKQSGRNRVATTEDLKM
jgi:diguanylate cyclase (GGDEF)-like protein/PAS domain S-box-containing protein